MRLTTIRLAWSVLAVMLCAPCLLAGEDPDPAECAMAQAKLVEEYTALVAQAASKEDESGAEFKARYNRCAEFLKKNVAFANPYSRDDERMLIDALSRYVALVDDRLVHILRDGEDLDEAEYIEAIEQRYHTLGRLQDHLTGLDRPVRQSKVAQPGPGKIEVRDPAWWSALQGRMQADFENGMAVTGNQLIVSKPEHHDLWLDFITTYYDDNPLSHEDDRLLIIALCKMIPTATALAEESKGDAEAHKKWTEFGNHCVALQDVAKIRQEIVVGDGWHHFEPRIPAIGGRGLKISGTATTLILDNTKGEKDEIVYSEPAVPMDDCIMIATFKVTAGPAGQGNGVVFRGKGEHAYVFNVTNDGRCALYERTPDSWNWHVINEGQDAAKTAHPAVKAGVANAVAIAMKGAQMTIKVNDTQVGVFTMPELSEGLVGLFVSDGNRVEVTEFTCNDLEETED